MLALSREDEQDDAILLEEYIDHLFGDVAPSGEHPETSVDATRADEMVGHILGGIARAEPT